jgi:hypothetical protein
LILNQHSYCIFIARIHPHFPPPSPHTHVTHPILGAHHVSRVQYLAFPRNVPSLASQTRCTNDLHRTCILFSTIFCVWILALRWPISQRHIIDIDVQILVFSLPFPFHFHVIQLPTNTNYPLSSLAQHSPTCTILSCIHTLSNHANNSQ